MEPRMYRMYQLAAILKTMDVPKGRLDVSLRANCQWLARNVRINNTNHPQLGRFLALLEDELKETWGETMWEP